MTSENNILKLEKHLQQSVFPFVQQVLKSPFVFALSGGVDSIALLHWLVANHYRPIVAHFNHRWHRRENGYVPFCQKIARKWDLPFVTASRQSQTAKTESAARQERYHFLLQTCHQYDCENVVTAHTANDQAETVLMRLIRGTGTAGMGGIRSVSTFQNITLIRPWLEISRLQVLIYARHYHLQWREDPINLDQKHLRARIRHRLIPYFKRYFETSIEKRLCQAASILTEENAWLEQQADEALKKIRDRSQPRYLVTKELIKLPLCLQRRVIKKWLQTEQINDLSFEDVESALQLLTQMQVAKVNLSRNRHLLRRRGRLLIYP